MILVKTSAESADERCLKEQIFFLFSWHFLGFLFVCLFKTCNNITVNPVGHISHQVKT